MSGTTKATSPRNGARQHDQHDEPNQDSNRQDGMSGFLGWIEKIGNKLPDPFWLFVILAGVVAVSSLSLIHI